MASYAGVKEFLNSLSGKQVQKVIWTLKLIKELETVPKQYFKKLISTDDIWEVRVKLVKIFLGCWVLLRTIR